MNATPRAADPAVPVAPTPARPRPGIARRIGAGLAVAAVLTVAAIAAAGAAAQRRRETAAAPAEVRGAYVDHAASTDKDVRYETEYAYTVGGRHYTSYSRGESSRRDLDAPATACYDPGAPEHAHLVDGRGGCP